MTGAAYDIVFDYNSFSFLFMLENLIQNHFFPLAFYIGDCNPEAQTTRTAKRPFSFEQ